MKISMRPKYQRKPKYLRERLQISKLQNPSTKDRFTAAVKDSLTPPDYNDDIETHWLRFKSSLTNTAKEILGTERSRKSPDWFADSETHIAPLLDAKHKAMKTAINKPGDVAAQIGFINIKREVRQEIRKIKDSWWKEKAREIQPYADNHDYRRFFEAIKTVYGPSRKASFPIRDAHGAILTDDRKILERWKEHYSQVLNQNNDSDLSILDLLPAYSPMTSLDDEISMSEIISAIKNMKNDKSPGLDGIPAEIFKALDEDIVNSLLILFRKIWEQGDVPQDFRDALVINLYKNKGDTSNCNNYRGISLLSVAGKFLSKIMADRLVPLLERLLPESQCGL